MGDRFLNKLITPLLTKAQALAMDIKGNLHHVDKVLHFFNGDRSVRYAPYLQVQLFINDQFRIRNNVTLEDEISDCAIDCRHFEFIRCIVDVRQFDNDEQAKIFAQYSVDGGTTWLNFSTTFYCLIDQTEIIISPYEPLPTATKTLNDARFRIAGRDGGNERVRVAGIFLEFSQGGGD